VFKNRVLRRIFGTKSDEATGELSKLHNGKLHSFYSSANIIRPIKSRRMRWVRHVEHEEGEKNVKVLLGKPEEKRQFGTPRRRRQNGIKTNVTETGWAECGVDSIGSG
jgi:hypothetical protein